MTKRVKGVAYGALGWGLGGLVERKGQMTRFAEIKEGFSARKDSNCFPHSNLSLPNIGSFVFLLLNLLGGLF